MKTLGSFAASIATYGVVAMLLFGDVFAPIALMTVFANRLGAPFWQLGVGVSAAISAGLVVRLSRRENSAYILAPAFVGLWMGLSVLLVGSYAETLRYRTVREFSPDDYLAYSFLRSIREAPRDFQFFLHAAALKNCRPYAWSYRGTMFYELPPNVAVNVLPPDWLARCAIERSVRPS